MLCRDSFSGTGVEHSTSATGHRAVGVTQVALISRELGGSRFAQERAGLLVGLLLTPHRRVLCTPGPWFAALFAGVLFAPHLLWQIQHDAPTLEFMRNATSQKMSAVSPGSFLLGLGAVSLERWTSLPSCRLWRPAMVVPLVAGGLITLPLALPILPVEAFVRYQSALGLAPATEERHEMGALPQHSADMFGWEELVDLVAEAHARLDPDKRARCRVFGQNYGPAGAVDVLGRRRGLPPAVSGHNAYWTWGPGQDPWDVLIIIGGDREDNAESFEELEIVGRTTCPRAMPYERGVEISIARRPKLAIHDVWPGPKRFR